jgi:hypothetical protein
MRDILRLALLTVLVVVAVKAVLFVKDVKRGSIEQQRIHLQAEAVVASPAQPVPIVQSSGYDYFAPPSISKEVYVGEFCAKNGSDSELCQQAAGMYDAIVAGGVDPALELAHVMNESSGGTSGVARQWFNLHGVHGHAAGGCRYGVAVANNAPGDESMQKFDNYAEGVADWVCMMREVYYNDGRNTPETVLQRYCDCGGDAGKAEYADRMKRMIDGWRQASHPTQGIQAVAVPNDQMEIRKRVLQLAAAQVGKEYVLGTAGPDTFDCSGLTSWAYHQVGIDITRTTFTQLDALHPIDVQHVQMGDMIYFQFPWDQHVGFLVDLNGDGKWDMLHAAAPGYGVMVTYDVLNDSFFAPNIIGYRTAF